MIFCAHHTLRALTGKNGTLINFCSNNCRSNEGYSFDVWMVTQRVDCIFTTMNHVKCPGWKTCSNSQLGQLCCYQRVLLGRFQNKGIATCDRHWKHPEWNHRGEIKWGYSCTNS